ncbi:MAG: electron transfer flavoprotein subunit beta/FixA family protein [Bifidobacteriaceae bacterium]|jgi:electron transfer flavoprotein beta subunit|nr:electron transfer flavoprotein subunit beta/FixA family protein [Bifidobacteriaceae bacterium]
MRIVVLVKYVPDIEIGYEFTPELRLDRTGDGLLSELDEHPLEEARRLAEELGAEVVALTVGPDEADEALRRALQMGADRAVHVVDDAIAGSDVSATALILARAVERLGGADLILTGVESADAGTGLLPVQLAARLQIPALTGAASLAIVEGRAVVRKVEDAATLTLAAPLPALVAVGEGANQPAYPSAKAVMLARRKPVDELSLDDLGLDGGEVGACASHLEVRDVAAAPVRVGGRTVDGATAEAMDAFIDLLRQNNLI